MASSTMLSMPATTPEEHRERIESFLERAAKILSMSAAQRQDLATLGSTVRVFGRLGDPVMDMQREHLPEEEIMAIAGLIRPLTLSREPVEISNVFASIGYLTQSAPPEMKQAIRSYKKIALARMAGWRWRFMTSSDNEPNGLTDREIAECWMYANLVHADLERRRRIQHVPEGERYLAATVWVSDCVLVTRAVQQLIFDLRRVSLL